MLKQAQPRSTTRFKSILNYSMLMVLITLLTGCNKMQMVDFKKINVVNKNNSYLVCPPRYCEATPDEIASEYPISVEHLQLAWQRMLAAQPRVKLVSAESAEFKYQYVQYSRVFHFPDYIDVEFIPISSKLSTLAIFSRARLGYYDFHVNQQRVKTWLSVLPNYF